MNNSNIKLNPFDEGYAEGLEDGYYDSPTPNPYADPDQPQASQNYLEWQKGYEEGQLKIGMYDISEDDDFEIVDQ